MTESNHRFIVLEGLDGAGTTTQAQRLNDYLTRRGMDSFLTFEPTPGAIGTFTRRLITGGLPPGGEVVSQRVLGLLFAADRLVHSMEIERHRAEGRHVVCDRYLLSSIAYQTLDPTIGAEWVAEANRGCAIPDITIFVDVPVAECMRRIRARAGELTMYEHEDHLTTILENYRRHFEFYAATCGNLITVDGTGTPDEVHAAIVAEI